MWTPIPTFQPAIDSAIPGVATPGVAVPGVGLIGAAWTNVNTNTGTPWTNVDTA